MQRNLRLGQIHIYTADCIQSAAYFCISQLQTVYSLKCEIQQGRGFIFYLVGL